MPYNQKKPSKGFWHCPPVSFAIFIVFPLAAVSNARWWITRKDEHLKPGSCRPLLIFIVLVIGSATYWVPHSEPAPFARERNMREFITP